MTGPGEKKIPIYKMTQQQRNEEYKKSLFRYLKAFHEIEVSNERQAIALANSFDMETGRVKRILTAPDLCLYLIDSISTYIFYETDPEKRTELFQMLLKALIVLIPKRKIKKMFWQKMDKH